MVTWDRVTPDGDFEGGKAGAVRVLGELGFTIRLRAGQPGGGPPSPGS